MIGVLTLLGEVDLQPILKKAFLKNEIQFLHDNFKTSVQLMESVEKSPADVVVIYSGTINIDTFPKLVGEIRKNDKLIRIILILNGGEDKYLRSQITEYKKSRIDLIFDDDGFNTDSLLNLIKVGKLADDEKRRQGDFQEFNKNETNTRSSPSSFSLPQCHYSIAVVNAAHGSGGTTTAIQIANFFAVQSFTACLLDMSCTGELSKADIASIPLYDEKVDISDLQKQYNVTVVDFGTPYSISPDGKSFKIDNGYSPHHIPKIAECDIKLIMGFTDIWNIGRIRFFLDNEAWKSMLDFSYLFLTADNKERLQKQYSDKCIFNRTDDFKESLLELFRMEE